MAKRTKITTEQAIGEFLFRRIQANFEYQAWSRDNDVPDYITDNIARDKTLRPYQEEAIKTFIWTYDRDPATAKHLLFNMATGTGKTLVMACCVLFLYTRGYRNFVFTVGRDNIIKQAEKNFTDYKFSKYLFNKNGIRINGRRVNVNVVNNPVGNDNNDINFTFLIINTLYNRLREPHENQLSLDDFKNNQIVIIADEAHHLNVDTRSKKKKEAEEAENWETVVNQAINVNPANMLLEFTATVDLKNEAIRQKYRDKLVYRYSFLEFNKDGYSKDVKFIYNEETQIENQKRLLIVNAVALSEFRRLFAERTMHVAIKPIVLVKSVKIAQSEADRKFFDDVIATLTVEDLRGLKDAQARNKTLNERHQYEIIDDMFNWIGNPRNGLCHGFDHGLPGFIDQIKMNFIHENTLIYNSQKKENPELLTQLDNPRNNIRVIFSVNALNEGWDVLSLYDIIHFDISPSKKVSLQDIQLIGRGARYCPYKLPANYRRDKNNNQSAMLNMTADVYKRKFDNDPFDTGRVLETMCYHFVKTGMFMENLREDLLGQGIIADGVATRTIRMKTQFMASETYRRGMILQNDMIYRKKTTADEIDTTFNQPINAGKYQISSADLSDKEQNRREASYLSRSISLTSEFFNRRIIEKALIRAEGGFFRFSNIRHHIVGIKTVDELIDKYLPMYDIKYWYADGKDIYTLNPDEKMNLLVGSILPEIRKKIDLNMPRQIGSRSFYLRPLADVFNRKKTIYLASFPETDRETGKKVYISSDERSKSQTDNEQWELRYNVRDASWYAYSENYGTSEEKMLVKWLGGQMPKLHERFPGCEIYLIRNELDYFLYSQKDGRRFSPDYLLIINDIRNHEMYYQVIIEPKGGHLLAKDEWKEQVLLDLNQPYDADTHMGYKLSSKVVTEVSMAGEGDAAKQLINQGYRIIKPLGLPFYNHEGEQFSKFTEAFREKLE